MERREEAEAALLEAHQIVYAALGAGHDRTVKTVDALAALCDGLGKPDKAAEWRAKLPTAQESLTTD